MQKMGLYSCCMWLLCLQFSLPALAESAIPSVQLPGGGRMPMSGMGLCCRPTAATPAVVQEIAEFIKLGGRHLDGAINYGNTKLIGEAIRNVVSSGVRREEIFFTTKIEPEMFGSEVTKQTMGYIMHESQLRYVDLVLLHMPASFSGEELRRCGTYRECRRQAWRALEELQSLGTIKHIGVSNFGIRHLQEVLEYARSPIAVNQIEYHPWVPATHHAVVDWCHAHGIVVTAYASLGSPMTTYTKKTAPDLKTTLERIGGVAERHKRPWQQVVLRWAIQHNVTVIPGTGNVAHMTLNLDLFDWTLSSEDMAVMDSVPEAERGVTFAHFVLDAAPEGLSVAGLAFPEQEPRPLAVVGVVAVALAICCWWRKPKRAKTS